MSTKIKDNFLVEIGTEELPPKSLRQLAEAFAHHFEKNLQQQNLTYDKVCWYASPRRLAIKVLQLDLKQQDQQIEKRGPALKAAFDDNGQATKAALGWAQSNGITIDQAERLVTDKGEWLVVNQLVAGQQTDILLVDMIIDSLRKLPITRAMRWGDKATQFIRPVHTVTLLLGDKLIDGEILGIKSSNMIQGHRFMTEGMAGKKLFQINHADQYPELLWQKGNVQADYEQRKQHIISEIKLAADKLGGYADLDDDLLEEVTSLVEYPVVLTASFEARFLAVPAEALVHTMKGDQKYFPVYDVNGKLLPKFIFVSNIKSREPHWVIEGNEKVVRPRLSDAEFFFNTDKKHKLESYLPRLDTVLFQQKLGSVKDKTDRIVLLSNLIAEQIKVDPIQAKRAALLSKCDLLTTMVFEFTDTQGIMGMHYAKLDGETDAVSLAIKEQYLPKFSGDNLPTDGVSSCVALADKLDTLVGIFGIGQAPKGTSDPFALRRASLGILRIIIGHKYRLDLAQLIDFSIEIFGDRLDSHIPKDVLKSQIFDFIYGRLKAFYQDQGYTTDLFQAVLARMPTMPYDFELRMQAVADFSKRIEAKALAASNKRVANILEKSGDISGLTTINLAMLTEPAEQTLAQLILSMQIELSHLWRTGDYTKGLDHLARLKQPIDDFFDQVMVMVEDPKIKENRLTMLSQLRDLFLNVADISLLQQEI